MAIQTELVPKSRPIQQLKDVFRTIHAELGTPSVDEIVKEALRRNLVSDFVKHSCIRRGLHEQCREALKKKTEGKVPYAQPLSDEESAQWKQTILFTCEEAIENLKRKEKAIDADIKEARNLANYWRDRYGDAIPHFSFEENPDD